MHPPNSKNEHRFNTNLTSQVHFVHRADTSVYGKSYFFTYKIAYHSSSYITTHVIAYNLTYLRLVWHGK